MYDCKLTTGQLVDQLKIGKRAICVETTVKKWVNSIVEAKEFSWKWTLTSGETEDFFLSKATQKCKWTILPEYVSFDKAMDALKSGKVVYFHGTDKTPSRKPLKAPGIGYHLMHSEINEWGLYSLYTGKWTIAD